MRHAAHLSALVLAFSTLAGAPAFARGNYSENFSDGAAQGWQRANTSGPQWSVTGGYYRNETIASPTIVYYTGTTWTTDFQYNLRAYSQWPDTGNLLGVVFGYLDANNYYEVLINMAGTVTLKRFVSGAVAWSTSGAVGALQEDSWFPVQLTFVGAQVTVRVNNVTALGSITLPAKQQGRLGLTTRSDMGRFDDINVVDPGANLLFRTTFSGASLEAEPDCGTSNCWREIIGTDTNFPDQQWPMEIWNGTGRLQQLVLGVPLTPQTISNYMRAEIQTVTGHAGNNTRALYQRIEEWGPGSTQMPHVVQPAAGAENGGIYARYWVKLQDNLTQVQQNSWRIFFQWKTDGDYRVSLYVDTYNRSSSEGANPPVTDHRPHWRLQGDNEANGGLPYEEFWRLFNTTVPVPIGEWFKFEVYWNRGSPGSEGRVWVAIDGQELFDYRGNLWGVNQRTINRIMAPTIYHGASQSAGSNFTEQWIDDIEIWDGFPISASPH